MLEISSQEWKNHIYFRDYLIKHPDKAYQYAELKKSLAQRFTIDREAYTEGKASFIESVLQSS
jgi:GrpB-like predicted nucleotidyltransferase (UPF0157 family)